jgi:hypothetical protein
MAKKAIPTSKRLWQGHGQYATSLVRRLSASGFLHRGTAPAVARSWVRGHEMNGPPQSQTITAIDGEKSFNWRAWILWPALMVIVYLLSFGPVLMVLNKRENQGLPDPRIVDLLYAPWIWTYTSTPFHKPLGIYMHFWDPKEFDKDGNLDLEIY